MALFKNNTITFDAKNSDTIIGHEAYFQGTLTAKGSLRVDGRVDGSIVDAKLVTVGKTGRIKGDISGEICTLSGEIKGNVSALGHIELLAGSRIDGDLRAPKITIEEGAIFNGACSMTGSKNQKTENSEKVSK